MALLLKICSFAVPQSNPNHPAQIDFDNSWLESWGSRRPPHLQELMNNRLSTAQPWKAAVGKGLTPLQLLTQPSHLGRDFHIQN